MEGYPKRPQRSENDDKLPDLDLLQKTPSPDEKTVEKNAGLREKLNEAVEELVAIPSPKD